MSFTFSEIVNSVFCAIIYGGFYFFIFLTLKILLSRIYSLKDFFISTYNYAKITERKKQRGNPVISAPFITFFDIFLFGIGFILLCYFSLDGCVRIYMAIISAGIFFILKRFLFSKLYDTVNKLFNCLEYLLLLVLRALFLPFIYLIRKISRNGTNYLAKFFKLKRSYVSDTLDKADEKC